MERRMIASPESLIGRPRRSFPLIQRPRDLPDRPDTEEPARLADPLSAVLRAVRLRGAVFFLIDASPPWLAEAPPGSELAPFILPGTQHLIEYHVVKRGTCYGSLIGGTPIQLAEGDVLVFPQGDPHVMSSSPNIPTRRSDRAAGDLEVLLGRSIEPPPV